MITNNDLISIFGEVLGFQYLKDVENIKKIIKKNINILNNNSLIFVNSKLLLLEKKLKEDNTYDPRKEIIDICLFLIDKGLPFGEIYEIYGGLEPGKEKLSDETNNLINEVKRKSGDILNKN